MKSIKKQLFLLGALMLISCIAIAQPPAPGQGGDGTAPSQGSSMNQSQTGPIGTATLLVLSLGAGAIGYKVHKNRKENK